MALAGSTGSQILEHIHFSRLAGGRVLAVLVTQAGAVQDRVLALGREMTHIELETSARYLNENFRGWLIERIRTEIARRMDQERAAYDALLTSLLTSVEELCRQGALASPAGPALFVDGISNLIAAEVDRERLRQLLAALEAKQRLVDLLSAYVDGRRQEVRVVVGLDAVSPARLALCHAGFGSHRRAGPPRSRRHRNRGAYRPHAHPISRDDSRRPLHRAALRAPPASRARCDSRAVSGPHPARLDGF